MVGFTSVTLLVPAVLWLFFLATALFQPPLSRLLLPLFGLFFAFFLVLPYPLFAHLMRLVLDIRPPWRVFRYLRITSQTTGHFQRPHDWRFIGVVRKSE